MTEPKPIYRNRTAKLVEAVDSIQQYLYHRGYNIPSNGLTSEEIYAALSHLLPNTVSKAFRDYYYGIEQTDPPTKPPRYYYNRATHLAAQDYEQRVALGSPPGTNHPGFPPVEQKVIVKAPPQRPKTVNGELFTLDHVQAYAHQLIAACNGQLSNHEIVRLPFTGYRVNKYIQWAAYEAGIEEVPFE